MAVSVAIGTRETRDQHIRSELANDTDDVRERNVVTAPLLKSFFRRLRISEVGNAGEPLLDSVITIGGEQFQRTQYSELVGKGVAGFILSTFASSERQQKGFHTLAA